MQDPLKIIREMARDDALREHFDAVKDDVTATAVARDIDGFAQPGSVQPEVCLPDTTYDESISSNLWDVLACDIALGRADVYAIAKAYSVDVDQIEALLENEQFVAILREKKNQVQRLGDKADFVMKMQAVAEQGIPHLARHLFNPNTPTKDFVALYKQVVDLAELAPKETSSGGGSVGVTFNIQGVPGLEHLQGKSTTIELDTSKARPKEVPQDPQPIEMEEL